MKINSRENEETLHSFNNNSKVMANLDFATLVAIFSSKII
jgi:hypothetical protein